MLTVDNGVQSTPRSDPRPDSYRSVGRRKRARGRAAGDLRPRSRSRSTADSDRIAKRNSQAVLCGAIVVASGMHKCGVESDFHPQPLYIHDCMGA